MEALSDSAPVQDGIELPDAAGPAAALADVTEGVELSEDESSWLGSLFQRIFKPITDLFGPSEESGEAEKDGAETVRERLEGRTVEDAAEMWHVQDGDNSCAVCCQQFIINEFLDLDLSEEQLCQIAQMRGWFEPDVGTPAGHTGDLLAMFGIETHVNYEGSIGEIKDALDRGGRVIAAVDGMALWVNGFGNFPVTGADHAVEIIGIDESDPLDVRVIINDSGDESGGGKSVSYLEFMEAWAPSGGFMVSAFPELSGEVAQL